MKLLQSRSHIILMDEQSLGWLRHRFAIDLLQRRQGESAPGIELIQRMSDGGFGAVQVKHSGHGSVPEEKIHATADLPEAGRRDSAGRHPLQSPKIPSPSTFAAARQNGG